jgi:hypothetical protein
MWQHLHCYGYTCSEDPRLPDEHVCYWCLLGDTDTGNYTALQEIAVQRRAMYHVSKSGMRTKTDLANILGMLSCLIETMRELTRGYQLSNRSEPAACTGRSRRACS